MKNKNFYNVVNKTKLIDVFKKNKVMMNTYFGQLPSTGLSLDFTNEDTYNELVNAPGWIASGEHTDFTLYRRNSNFTQELSSEGTTLSTVGTSSQDRYGLVTTGSSTLGNKFSYQINFKLNWTGTPVESTKRTLLSWFMGDDPTSGDHTRINITVINGQTSISLETITTEGSTTRTVVYEAPFVITSTTMKLIWDTVNHTLQLVLNNNNIGLYSYYGSSLGYATIAGTNTSSYKPETSLLIKDIEIKGV